MAAERRPGRDDALAGLLVGAFGAFILWEGSGYPFGSVARIGPGFFPVVLGVALIGFGVAIALFERLPPTLGTVGLDDLRALVAIAGAIALFGLLIERVGLVPAVFGATFLSGTATPGFPLMRQALISTAITAGSVVLFVVLLDLPIEVFEW